MTATCGLPFNFFRKVSLYLIGRHRLSCQSLAVDSSEVVLPDSEVNCVLSVLSVLLDDTEVESAELNECDE